MENNEDLTMEKVSQMMQLPMNQIPAPAIEYLKALSKRVGFCGEVCVTAYAYYCQAVLGLPCYDLRYKIPPEATLWFQNQGYVPEN